MNKKGFTLIEMLAVIVLLGLLMGLLFPAISKYIIQTRDNTYTLYEANMKTSAQNMMNECIEENKANCIPKAGFKKRLTLSELVSTGYTDRLKDPKKESEECDPFQSFVTVRNDDSNITNLTYDVCLVCGEYKSNYCDSDEAQEIISETGCTAAEDTAPPECGVAVGASDIWSNKDREIIIGCSDDCTGCVQDTFTKVINTDTKTATIEIADNSGKRTSCPVDAYVDKTKPTCTLKVEGTVGDNGWYRAGTRPKVTLTVTGKDDEGKTDTSGIATYGIGTSKSNYDFNKETEYLVNDGITVVYGYVKDNAGNIGVCHTEEIKYDSVPPTVDNVDYGTIVYPKPDIATKSGATITLNDITGEYGTIYGFYIYMNNGYGGTVTVKNGSTTLRSSLTIPSATSKLKNNFATAKSYNNLSFTFGSETEANNVSRIELLTRDDTIGYYTNQNVTLYINSLDSVSGKANYSFDDGNSYQDENYRTYTYNTVVKMKASDYSGNISDNLTKEITNIDKIQPQCTVTFGNSSVTTHENNYYWENVPVTLTKDDSAATSQYTKSNTRYYGLKNTNGLLYNMLYTGTQTLDTDGHVWYGYVIDKAGNTKDCNSTVKKDSQNPTCTLTKEGTVGVEEWYRSDVTVSFSAKGDVNKDGVQSGMVYYQIDTSSSNPSSWTTQNSNVQTADTSGTTWYGHVKDKAGRTTTCTINVKKDTIQPTCDIAATGSSGENDWFVGTVTVTTTPNDERSGVYQKGIGSYDNRTTLTHTTDTTGTTYTCYVKDKAGNENTKSITVKKDTQNPSCTLTKSGTEGLESWYRSDVTISFASKNDNNKDGTQSGIAYYQIDTSSGNPSSWITQNSNTQNTDTYGTTWYGHVKDYAGNTASCNISVKRDTVKPKCSISYSCTKGNNNWCISDVKVVLGSTVDQGTVQSGRNGYGINAYNQLDEMLMKTDTTGQTMVAYSRDTAGNECTASTTYKRDTVNPYCVENMTDCAEYGASGTIVCYDDTSGLTSNNFNHTYVADHFSFVWNVTDNAGHSIKFSGKTETKTMYKKRTCNTHKSCVHSSCGSYYTKSTNYCGRTYHASTCQGGWTNCTWKYKNYQGSGACMKNCPGYSDTNSWSCEPHETGYGVTCAYQKCTWNTCATGSAAYYSYWWGNTNTSYNQTSCTNNHISCGSSTYGSYYTNCTWTAYQSCVNSSCDCNTWNSWQSQLYDSCTSSNSVDCESTTAYCYVHLSP